MIAIVRTTTNTIQIAIAITIIGLVAIVVYGVVFVNVALREKLCC